MVQLPGRRDNLSLLGVPQGEDSLQDAEHLSSASFVRPSAMSHRWRGPVGQEERPAYCSAYLSTFSLVTMTTGVRISWGTFSPFRARMAATTLQ